MYKLFLDDERYPNSDLFEWRIARNFDDACWYIRNIGMPTHISFDHDLGSPQNRTGHDFAKWIVNHMLDNHIRMEWTWHVHSMNPVGAENIRKFLECFQQNE